MAYLPRLLQPGDHTFDLCFRTPEAQPETICANRFAAWCIDGK